MKRLFEEERVFANPVLSSLFTAVPVFLADAVAIYIIKNIPNYSLGRKLLIDALLISFISYPIFYLLLIYPLCSRLAHHRKARKVLEESENKYRSLIESTEDSVYLMDGNYKYLFMNKQHQAKLGLSDDELKDSAYGNFHSPEETEEFIKEASRVFERGESVQHRYRSKRDGKYFVRTLSPVKDADGMITGITVVSKDITELKNMEEKLYSLSLTDELTGIYNRRGFFTLAEQQLKLSKRIKVGIYLLYADVDNLKDINDTFGHQEGDAALIDAANILKNTFRESDIVGRIGGDEFVVIPIGIHGDHIEIIKARLARGLAQYNAEKRRHFRLSMSVGIAYYDPEVPCSIQELLNRADKTMYEKKRERKRMVMNNGQLTIEATTL